MTEIEKNKEVLRLFADAINKREWEDFYKIVNKNFTRLSYSALKVNSREELKEYA